MITVRIPSALRPYAGNEKDVSLDATNVASALEQLVVKYPSLTAHLYDESGELRQYVNLFIDDANIRDLEGLQTPLDAGARLLIIPSIAGGSQEMALQQA
jgi:molybdopterin converting factor small subunit